MQLVAGEGAPEKLNLPSMEDFAQRAAKEKAQGRKERVDNWKEEVRHHFRILYPCVHFSDFAPVYPPYLLYYSLELLEVLR